MAKLTIPAAKVRQGALNLFATSLRVKDLLAKDFYSVDILLAFAIGQLPSHLIDEKPRPSGNRQAALLQPVPFLRIVGREFESLLLCQEPISDRTTIGGLANSRSL
jgi:hypothetical protein